MADCKIVNPNIIAAINQIGGSEQGHLIGIAKKYETAGIALMDALNIAISNMEGETKEALKNFLDATVKQYVVTDLPVAINALSVLLESNRANFEEVDRQIAECISGSIIE